MDPPPAGEMSAEELERLQTCEAWGFAPGENLNPKAREAFETWYGMWPKRNISKLLMHYVERAAAGEEVPATSRATLDKWSHRYNWVDRAVELDRIRQYGRLSDSGKLTHQEVLEKLSAAEDLADKEIQELLEIAKARARDPKTPASSMAVIIRLIAEMLGKPIGVQESTDSELGLPPGSPPLSLAEKEVLYSALSHCQEDTVALIIRQREEKFRLPERPVMSLLDGDAEHA